MKSAIVCLWVRYIIGNDKTFDQVPTKLKDDVRNQLIAAGYNELVTE